MNQFSVPLFPLNTVLFPGGPLPLRIFEPRYLDMISYCLRNNSPFGVCLIREGREVDDAALTYEVGTLARIVDWDQRADGLLGIDAVGEQRFRTLSRDVRSNRLIEGEIELIDNETDVEIPPEYLPVVDLLEQFIARIGHPYDNLDTDYDSASWVSQRFAELLPMPLTQRQSLLELSGPLERLEVLQEILRSLNIRH